MFRSIKNKFGTVLTVLMVVSLVFSPSAQAQGLFEDVGPERSAGEGRSERGAPGRGAPVESIMISDDEQAAALNFWTRETLMAAQSMDLMVDTNASGLDPATLNVPSAELEKVGEFGSAPGGMADADANTVAQVAYAADWEAIVAEVNTMDSQALAEPTGTSQVFTSYNANLLSSMQRIYPHIWAGRVSFVTPSGTSYCSGTAISGNVMLTAAHCLYDTAANRWFSRWAFTPAYRLGSAPYGTFAATQCWILTSWINLPGYSIPGARYDIGVCKMGRNSAGQTLNSAVGWAGRMWNFGYSRHFHTMGYPFRDYRLQTLPSAGSYLRLCAAESFYYSTDVRGMGCDWGPGISGGPWMIGYAPGAVQGWVDGVNSGLFVNQANLYGPRFTSNNIVPLCTAAGC